MICRHHFRYNDFAKVSGNFVPKFEILNRFMVLLRYTKVDNKECLNDDNRLRITCCKQIIRNSIKTYFKQLFNCITTCRIYQALTNEYLK